MVAQTLTQQQLNALTRFTSKHHVIEIKLNKAESRYFFDFIEEAPNLERSRILLQPVFAEGYYRNDNDDMVVIIIQRVRLLQTDDIVWEDGYDDRPQDSNENHYNPFTRRLFEVFIDKMGLDVLMEKIALQLSKRFPISKGQATAIMKKEMGLHLDSGTRSFLHDLRKKIRKYQLLVSEFQEYVLDNERPKLIPLHYIHELVQNINSGDIDKVLDNIPEEWINRPQKGKQSDFESILNERRKISESDKEMAEPENKLLMQNSPSYELVCQECDEIMEFVPDPTDRTTVELPQHHNKPMSIRIIPED